MSDKEPRQNDREITEYLELCSVCHFPSKNRSGEPTHQCSECLSESYTYFVCFLDGDKVPYWLH